MCLDSARKVMTKTGLSGAAALIPGLRWPVNESVGVKSRWQLTLWSPAGRSGPVFQVSVCKWSKYHWNIISHEGSWF